MKFSRLRVFSQRNLLILVAGFFILNNAVWWSQNKFIQGPDEGKHLFLSILNLNKFPEQVFFGFEASEAPFYYLTAGFFYRIFHSTSYYVSMLNNVMYMILLLIGVSRLERLFLGTRGLLAPVSSMLIPQMAVHSRFFNPDIALCAFLAWFLYFLKKIYDDARWGYCLALTLLVFAGAYTKVSFFAFCVPVTLYYLVLSLKAQKIIRIKQTFILVAAQLLAFYVFYPDIIRELSWFASACGKLKLFHAQHTGDISAFVIPFKYYQKGFWGKIQEELFLIFNSHLGFVIFFFFIFSLIALMASRIKRRDKACMSIFFLGSLLLFTFSASLHLEDRYLLPLVIFEAVIMAYGAEFLLKKGVAYKSIAAVFFVLCLVQYYGISYSARFLDYFSKFRVFNTVVNLTYYPFTSQNRIIWSVPYSDNPAREIVSIMQQNFREGLDYKVYFLDAYIPDDYMKSSFAFFLSCRVNYYALKRGLPLETLTTMDIRDAGILVVKESSLQGAGHNDCCLVFKEAKLIPDWHKELFSEFCENAEFRFFKKIFIYNPVTEKKESFILYLRSNRDFLTEETRKLAKIFKGFKLFIVLKDKTVLDINRGSVFTRDGGNFSIAWPKDKLLIKGEIESKGKGDIGFIFYSDRIEDIKLVQMAVSVFSDTNFYFNDNGGFRLLEGKLEVPTLMSNNRFSEGLRTSRIIKYFTYEPRIPYDDYFSQVEFVNKEEIDLVYGLRPSVSAKNPGELFSIRISDTLSDKGASKPGGGIKP